MYQSPIEAINVDKEELIKALKYDRNQYIKGYEDGRKDVLVIIRAEIEQSIKDHDEFADFGRMYGLQIALDIIDKYEEVNENV